MEPVTKKTAHLGLGWGLSLVTLRTCPSPCFISLAMERISFQGSQKLVHQLPAHYDDGGHRSMKTGKAEAVL